MSDQRRRTSSGVDVKPHYGSPTPGEFPFTRGIYETMYRGRLWTMRQYAGFGSAKESNQRYKLLLNKGQTGLSVAFDLPTQMGYDSDHALARGEVGRVGVAISTIEDMELLLKDLPLHEVSTSMTINATASILLAFYLAVSQRRGIEFSQLQGTIQNDLLKEYIARGTYIFPPQPSLRIITDIFDYCRKSVPHWNTISISGYHIREAGANAVQEIAFTLANALTYVEAALERGLEIDSFAPRLSFFFSVDNNFLEEVAKFRAARSLWAQIMKERFGAKNPNSLKLRFHAQTAGSTLTAQQPDNNIARVALQALAAIFGGTQSLHTNSMDEALGLPTEAAATTALRTQQIIAHETGVTDVADPLGGAFVVEELTREIESRAKDYLEQIRQLGGVVRCIQTGWIQREIQNSAYEHQQALEAQLKQVVGVNIFQTEQKAKPSVLKINSAIERDQLRRLNAFKKKRKKSVLLSHLNSLENAARGKANLMPYLISGVESGLTLGEISDCLRNVFGTFKESVSV